MTSSAWQRHTLPYLAQRGPVRARRMLARICTERPGGEKLGSCDVLGEIDRFDQLYQIPRHTKIPEPLRKRRGGFQSEESPSSVDDLLF